MHSYQSGISPLRIVPAHPHRNIPRTTAAGLPEILIVGTQTRGFGSPHARNGRLAAVTRNITVGCVGTMRNGLRHKINGV